MKSNCLAVTALIIAMCMTGCSKPTTAEPETAEAIPPPPASKSGQLWAYLNGFSDKDSLPTIAEIQEKFGEPDEPVSAEATMSMPAKRTMAEMEMLKDAPIDMQRTLFLRFSPEEVTAEVDVDLVQHIYNHGDEGGVRYVEIYVRLFDGTVAGWDWVENVSPDDRIGAPK
jgi:hypothetical protein